MRLADLSAVLFALVTAMAASRNTTAAAAVTAVAGAPYLHRSMLDLAGARHHTDRRRRTGMVVLAGTALLVLLLPSLALRAPAQLRFHVPSDTPLELMDQLPVGSRVFTDSVVGPFVTVRRWPEVLIAFDGRIEVYPTKRYMAMREVTQGMPGWDDTLVELGATHVLVGSDDPLRAALAGSARWQAVASDEHGYALFGRSAS